MFFNSVAMGVNDRPPSTKHECSGGGRCGVVHMIKEELCIGKKLEQRDILKSLNSRYDYFPGHLAFCEKLFKTLHQLLGLYPKKSTL